MKIDKRFFRTFILYGIIGGLSAGADTLLFALLHKTFGINPFIANVFSVHVGIFLSFFLNSHYNFKKTDQAAKRFAAFYVTGLFGLGLSSLILWAGKSLSLPIMATKIFSIVFVACVQFLINRWVAFGER